MSRNDGRDWTLAGTAALARRRHARLRRVRRSPDSAARARRGSWCSTPTAASLGRDVSPAFRIDGAKQRRTGGAPRRRGHPLLRPTVTSLDLRASPSSRPTPRPMPSRRRSAYSTDGGATYDEPGDRIAHLQRGRPRPSRSTLRRSRTRLRRGSASRSADGTSSDEAVDERHVYQDSRRGWAVRTSMCSPDRARAGLGPAVQVVDEAALTGHQLRASTIDGSDAFAQDVLRHRSRPTGGDGPRAGIAALGRPPGEPCRRRLLR